MKETEWPADKLFQDLSNVPRTVIFAGGVGGARFVHGFYDVFLALQARNGNIPFFTAVINTGDDFFWNGLRICPDLDTNLYTLAGLNDEERGWGLRNDTGTAMKMLGRWEGQNWFNMSDSDIAVSIRRSAWLAEGMPLSEVTSRLCRGLGVIPCLLPMSDTPAETYVRTSEGTMHFQNYFVEKHFRPRPEGFEYRGIDKAEPAPGLIKALNEAELIVIAPSNPFVSILTSLSVPGVREAVEKSRAFKIAVSPLRGSNAFKGPLPEMLAASGRKVSAAGVFSLYSPWLEAALLDQEDFALESELRACGIKSVYGSISLRSRAERREIAESILREYIRKSSNNHV